MSHSLIRDGAVDVQKLAQRNPNVDVRKVREVREMLRILREQGVSEKGYELTPPFRRRMYVQGKHENVDR